MQLHNPVTGEIYDLTTDQGVIDAYHSIKIMNGSLKKMNDKLNQILKEKIGDNDEMKVGVYTLKATKQTRTEYPVSLLREIFDEDQLMECLKPVNKKVEELSMVLNDDAKQLLTNGAITREVILPPKLI